MDVMYHDGAYDVAYRRWEAGWCWGNERQATQATKKKKKKEEKKNAQERESVKDQECEESQKK